MINSTLLKRRDGVLSTEVDGEAVLMCIESGLYYTMDSIGSVVWSMLEKPQSLGDIQSRLVEHFAGDADTIREESNKYLEDLVERKLVEAEAG